MMLQFVAAFTLRAEALDNNRTMQALAAPPTLKIFPFQNLVL
jgi:hypothetical protein